ncbi:MAG: O-antigen ligase family protein [Candidatus Omnitrophica bacterium]|nr:O-antigen ligase family protein [Candidatus Omnitrophota bacterium]
MDKNKLIVYFLLLTFGLALSFFTITSNLDFKITASLIFLLIFIPTLIKPEIGLVIIIVSMLFSPEVILGKTASREITLRIEDIFLLVVILASLIKTAFTKDIGGIFKTKLTLPFFLYIGACVLSTLLASISSDMKIRNSFFSILKYLEYFLFFLIAKDNIKTLKQAKVFVAIFLLVSLIVAFYSNVFVQKQLESGAEFFRVAPPVETRKGGEAGTLGGYLVFMMAIAAGLLLYLRPLSIKIFLICLIALMFRPFLYTLSRGSYLAFFPAIFALVFFSKKITFAYASVFFLIIIILFMPSMVKKRISETIIAKQDVQKSYMELEVSPKERIESYKNVLFKRFPASPIFGYGVGRYFIDGQIFLTLCEVGLLGLIFFIWVLVRLFREARKVFYTALVKNDDFAKGLSVGFLSGFVGLLFHSLSANTFIIIRIMEPFWFMAAILICLPQLMEQEEAAIKETG